MTVVDAANTVMPVGLCTVPCYKKRTATKLYAINLLGASGLLRCVLLWVVAARLLDEPMETRKTFSGRA